MSERCLSALNVSTSNSLPNHLKKEGEVIIKVQSATVLSRGAVLAGTDKRWRHRAQTEVLRYNLELWAELKNGFPLGYDRTVESYYNLTGFNGFCETPKEGQVGAWEPRLLPASLVIWRAGQALSWLLDSPAGQAALFLRHIRWSQYAGLPSCLPKFLCAMVERTQLMDSETSLPVFTPPLTGGLTLGKLLNHDGSQSLICKTGPRTATSQGFLGRAHQSIFKSPGLCTAGAWFLSFPFSFHYWFLELNQHLPKHCVPLGC